MANSNIASIGRFSSQMLTYFGTQKTVKNVDIAYANTFKYASAPTTFVNPGSLLQSDISDAVVGSYSSGVYDSTKSYFLSRGVGPLYAESMTALVVDMANSLGISSQAFLEQSEIFGKFSLPSDAYLVFNDLRDPSHQVGTVVSVINKKSLQAREIRS